MLFLCVGSLYISFNRCPSERSLQAVRETKKPQFSPVNSFLHLIGIVMDPLGENKSINGKTTLLEN